MNTVDELISDIRQGRMVVIMDGDETGGSSEGVVMVAADHVSDKNVNFMARKARGLVCLSMTEARCRQLNLSPMVGGAHGEKANFTLSIEAVEGITTGISAADRARTVEAAVAENAKASDIVQPGHIFPQAAVAGGVLIRAGHVEASSDYARLAGLLPAAVITDILTAEGNLAGREALLEFAKEHKLKIGTIADLIHYRMVNERSITQVREGRLNTAYGEFNLRAYQDGPTGEVHIVLTMGEIKADTPTLVRVHVKASLRDLLAAEFADGPSWSIATCLRAVANKGCGAIVLLAGVESVDQLLGSIDRALALEGAETPQRSDAYATVGIGSQILTDIGIGKILLMGAPIKYNAISGFGLEVVKCVMPSDLELD